MWRDHPRSRGVYRGCVEQCRGADGSSPLARGLRHLVQHRPMLDRIIPARAGFTPHCPALVSPARDHPRSRGVYAAGGGQITSGAGSSPLARGLLSGARWGSGPFRIIPARAGFTLAEVVPGQDDTDHPRSRGVYCLPRKAIFNRLGSSPLARGLHRVAPHQFRINRIIPARAGFTAHHPGPRRN